MNEEQIREIAELMAKCKNNEERIAKIEEKYELLYKMNNNIETLTLQLQYTVQELTGLKSDMESIKSKPNRLLESVIEKIIMVIIGAAIGLVMSGVGLS